MRIKISEAELEIMQILWSDSPLTSREIIERLSSKEWSEKTIRTFIHRLTEKEAIKKITTEKSFLFVPVIDKKTYYSTKKKSFIEKFYQGSIKNMIANFIEEEELSKEEIQELKDLLDKKS